MTEERKFGLLFTVVFAVISAYTWWKESVLFPYFAGAAGFFLVAGFVLEPVLKPIRTYWMKFAHVLAWLNTRIILGLFYYLVMTPVGILLRLFGKDLLEKKIDRRATSYWTTRGNDETPRERYDRLF